MHWLTVGVDRRSSYLLAWSTITGLADRSKSLHLLQLLNFLGIVVHSSQSIVLAFEFGLGAFGLLLLQLGKFLIIVVVAMQRVCI